MRSFVLASAILMLLAATAAAGELAVSKSTLSDMGLGGMQSMTDSDGLAVRGKGTFASVWGGSKATFPGQSSENHYEAGAQWLGKGSSAGGNSLSFAGAVQIDFAAEAAFPPPYAAAVLQIHAVGGIAGGGANAWAN
jgi:hypothetical protein